MTKINVKYTLFFTHFFSKCEKSFEDIKKIFYACDFCLLVTR